MTADYSRRHPRPVRVHPGRAGPVTIVPAPDSVLIEVDTLLPWGHVLATVAASQPQVLTVSLASPFMLGEVVPEQQQEHFDIYTRKSILSTAWERGFGVLAISPLKHVEKTVRGAWTPLVWRRYALAVPLAQGWEPGDSDDP